MPQAFLHAREDRLVVARLDIDHAIGRESGLREGRREQVGPSDAPQDLAFGARRDSADEKCRGSAIDGAISAACYFMQCAES